jgi:predicted lipopolysaccharide heptosyltransferase III
MRTRKKVSLDNIKKILVIKLAGIGDLILASPALRALRKRFPKAHIALLTISRAKELAEGSPYIDELFCLNPASKNLREIVRLIRSLRRKRFDMAINLYNLFTLRGALKMVLLIYSIGARYRVGRNTDNRGFFYTIKVPDERFSDRHEVEYNLDVVQALGADIKDKGLEISISDKDREFVQEFLKQNGIGENDLVVGINPGAFRPSHRWSQESFARIADRLTKKYEAKILITGGPEEIELAQKIADMMKIEPIIATGEVTIKQLVSLIERCNLFISNDTGAMHIAAAMKTPLIALLGPGPLRYSPYGNKDRYIVIKKDVGCSPCYKFRCKKHLCMKLITVEDVLKAAEELLRRFPK